MGGSMLNYYDNPQANETVKLPQIKDQLKFKMKKSKKRKMYRTPIQKDALYQQMFNQMQKQKGNINYDFEEKQNSRLAKLLNLDSNDTLFTNGMNYNSDDNREFQQQQKQQQQISFIGNNINNNNQVNNSSTYGNYSNVQKGDLSLSNKNGYNLRNNQQQYPQQYKNLGDNHIYYQDERQQFQQNMLDTRLPIITSDSSLQTKINGQSSKHISKNNVENFKYRNITTHHKTQPITENQLKRNSAVNMQQTPGISNDGIIRAQNNYDTTFISTTRNVNQMQEQDINQFETLSQNTIDSRQQNRNINNHSQVHNNNGYNMYQQHLYNSVKTTQNPNFIINNASQIYNQKVPNYLKPTQKHMSYIREVSSGKSSNRTQIYNNRGSHERYNSQLLSQQQHQRQPRLQGQQETEQRRGNNTELTNYFDEQSPYIQNRQSNKQYIRIDNQQQQYTQQPLTQDEMEQMKIERENKLKEHNEKVQSIVQKLTSPTRKNRFCPCCQNKIENSDHHSPYNELGRDKNHNHNYSKDSLNSSHNKIIILQDQKHSGLKRHHDHNQSENNILDNRRQQSHSVGHNFLRKGQNKLAHKRVPEGMHLNQFPQELVSDTQSQHSSFFPKFANGKKPHQWRYTGNKSYLIPSITPKGFHTHKHRHQKGDSFGQNSPRFASKRMSQDVEDRLLGRSSTNKKICSTLHNHVNSPMAQKQQTLEPLIKPRPLSAEKILKNDISLSPIQFSQQDRNDQVSDGAFAPQTQELEIQTQNHLLNNFKWKAERSIEVATTPPVEEIKPKPRVEILQDPIVIPIIKTPPNEEVEEESKQSKPFLKYDWAESEVYNHVLQLHQYDKFKQNPNLIPLADNQNQNQQNIGGDQVINNNNNNNHNNNNIDLKKSGSEQSIQLYHQQPIQLNISDKDNQRQDQSLGQAPKIEIDDYTDLIADNQLQNQIDNQHSQNLIDLSKQHSVDYLHKNSLQQLNNINSVNNLSDIQTEHPYNLKLGQQNQYDKIELMSKDTDRNSQQTIQQQVDHNISYKDQVPKRFGHSNSLNQTMSHNQSQLQSIENAQNINIKQEQNNNIAKEEQRNLPQQKVQMYDVSQQQQQNASNPNEPLEINYEQLINGKNINTQNDIDNNTQGSQIEKLNNQLNQNYLSEPPQDDLNPHNYEIYTEIEATYKASLLKKKTRTYNTPETLLEFHQIARKTIEVLTCNMIQSDISLERIFEFYEEVTRPNVIKMLLRCRLLYQARVDVKKILQQIIKKEEMYEDMQQLMKLGMSNLQRLNQQELSKLFSEGLRLIQRLISQINSFRHEHKIFKGQFIFKAQDYQEVLVQQRNEIQDYIWNNSGLQESINAYQNQKYEQTNKYLSQNNSQQSLEIQKDLNQNDDMNINNNNNRQKDIELYNDISQQVQQQLLINQQIDDLTLQNPVQKIIISEQNQKQIIQQYHNNNGQNSFTNKPKREIDTDLNINDQYEEDKI